MLPVRTSTASALLALCLLFLVLSVPSPVSAKTQATVSELSENAEKQVALLVRSARRSKEAGLSPQNPEAKPFWAALKGLNEAVTRLGNGVQFQDESFHKALGDTVKNAVAVTAALELTGVQDAAVGTALSRLEETVGILQKNFSKASARERQGGKLSKAETKKLEAIKAKQADLEKRLAAIEPKVRKNPKAMRVIREVRDRSIQIRRADPTVADFLAAVVAVRIIDGIIWGGHWWWGPWGVWFPDYSLTYISLHDEVLADIAYDWAYYEALQADLEDAILEDALDDAELYEAEEFLEQEIDAELDREANLDLDGIADVTPEDLDNPDFGLDEADQLPTEELPEAEATVAPADVMPEDPAIDAGDTVEPEAELLPEVQPEPLPEPDPMPEIVDLPEPEVFVEEALPEMPDGGGFDDLGGFDDAGFDDFDGGFDFD